jgi:glycerol-3-phosphate O-acyltransferase
MPQSWSLRPGDVEGSPSYAAALRALATQLGLPPADVAARCRQGLAELRTGHSPQLYRGLVAAGRSLLRSGYEGVDYDAAGVERARALLTARPAIVLSSHKSYLDGGALTVGFAEHGLPPLTVFAGINMSFWPIGPFWRRANGVFIRRSGHDATYAFALRQQLGALVERRRPLQWFIEGTRSRTGELGRPRLGLLVYAVDAWRDGRCDDLTLLPIAIAYDLLRDAAEYAREARGARKQAETLGWLLRFVREQRGRMGRIYVRFGEPLVLRDWLGPASRLPPRDAPETRALLQDMAAEVCRRIESAMPVTASALLALHLLGAPQGERLPIARLQAALRETLAFLEARMAPLTESARALASPAGLEGALALFAANGLLAEGGDRAGRAVGIAPGAELEAAYYRNTILHHLRDAAVAELGRIEGASAAGAGGAVALGVAPAAVLRPEAETVLLVAEVLESLGEAALPDVPALIEACLARGRQALAQGCILCPEAVSTHRFREMLDAPAVRALAGSGTDAATRRRDFAVQARAALQRLERRASDR